MTVCREEKWIKVNCPESTGMLFLDNFSWLKLMRSQILFSVESHRCRYFICFLRKPRQRNIPPDSCLVNKCFSCYLTKVVRSNESGNQSALALNAGNSTEPPGALKVPDVGPLCKLLCWVKTKRFFSLGHHGWHLDIRILKTFPTDFRKSSSLVFPSLGLLWFFLKWKYSWFTILY